MPVSSPTHSQFNVAGAHLTWKILFGLVFFTSLAVRVWASSGNLWLDEILSLSIAQSVHHPLDIITKLHHDNSHPLNTFFMYILGNQKSWLVYRLPSLLAGSGAVAMAGVIGGLRGRLEALTFMILTGFSYLLIHYSSEARGYGLVFLFLLTAFYAALRYEENQHWVWAILFWASSLLGILSNLIYFYFYFALLAWFIGRQISNRPPWRHPLRSILRFYALPTLGFIAFYMIHLRHIVIRGGPEYPKLTIALQTIALSIGTPSYSLSIVATTILVFIAFGYGLIILRRDGSNLHIFFLALVILNFGFLPKFIYARYFLSAIIFFYLLLGYVLVDIYHRGLSGKIIYLTLLIFFIVGNSFYTNKLLKYGRGGYFEALHYIVNHTKGAKLSIINDDDFNNKPLLDYYIKYLTATKIIQLYSLSSPPKTPPEWFISHDCAGENPPTKCLNRLNGNYTLVKSFPFAALSGVTWYIYHRESPLPGP